MFSIEVTKNTMIPVGHIMTLNHQGEIIGFCAISQLRAMRDIAQEMKTMVFNPEDFNQLKEHLN